MQLCIEKLMDYSGFKQVLTTLGRCCCLERSGHSDGYSRVTEISDLNPVIIVLIVKQ